MQNFSQAKAGRAFLFLLPAETHGTGQQKMLHASPVQITLSQERHGRRVDGASVSTAATERERSTVAHYDRPSAPGMSGEGRECATHKRIATMCGPY